MYFGNSVVNYFVGFKKQIIEELLKFIILLGCTEIRFQ